MARPKSDSKRKAILSAAIQVFAERGLSAPTSAISNSAGVADGTLFTYYSTKDDLLNALYREIKSEIASAILAGFPEKKSVRQRLLHVWNCFVNWGVANPGTHAVLRQVEVWSGLTAESKAFGAAPFSGIQSMAEDAARQRLFRDVPEPYIVATIDALAEMAMDFMRRDPKRAELYRSAGFEMLWAAIGRER